MKMKSDGKASAYYDFPEGCSTLNDLIEYKNMSFAQGNIFKAAYRLGNKEGISLEYDLNKIIYYAERSRISDRCGSYWLCSQETLRQT
jgi:hypothetical protein